MEISNFAERRATRTLNSEQDVEQAVKIGVPLDRGFKCCKIRFNFKATSFIFKALLNNSNLREFEYEDNTYESLDAIGELLKYHPTLEKITIKIKVVAPENQLAALFRGIESAKNLKELRLGVYIDDQKTIDMLANALSKNKKIRKLDLLNSAKFIYKQLGLILYNNNIEEIIVRSLVDSSSLTEPLKNNTTLKTLDLSGSRVRLSFEFSSIFNTNTTLETLKIFQITSIEPINQILKATSTLKSLHISPALRAPHTFDLSSIINGLRANNSVRQLNLSSNLISDSNFLASVIGLKNITELNISSILMEEDALDSLAKELESNKTLRKINMSRLKLGEIENEIALQSIAYFMKENPNLIEIILRNNGFDDRIECIAKAMENNTHLKVIDLEGNYLGLTGSEAIFNAVFKSNNTIEEFIYPLAHPNFEEFINAFKFNNTIRSIDIAHPDMKKNDYKNLAEVLKNNDTLTHLKIIAPTLYDFKTEIACNDIILTKELINIIEDVLSVNRSLRNVIVDDDGKNPITFDSFTDNNVKYQHDLRSDTIILMYNIVQSQQAKELFPLEIWRQIFGSVKYPGFGYLKNEVARIL